MLYQIDEVYTPDDTAHDRERTSRSFESDKIGLELLADALQALGHSQGFTNDVLEEASLDITEDDLSKIHSDGLDWVYLSCDSQYNLAIRPGERPQERSRLDQARNHKLVVDSPFVLNPVCGDADLVAVDGPGLNEVYNLDDLLVALSTLQSVADLNKWFRECGSAL